MTSDLGVATVARSVPLQVYTCRVGSRAARDRDLLVITREEADERRLPGIFAPSWALLRPALDARLSQRRGFVGGASEAQREAALVEARELELASWRSYVPAYVEEMRASYRRHREEWERLLARPRVVLACKCKAPERCHRTILATMILPKLGAAYYGERASTRAGVHVELVEVAR